MAGATLAFDVLARDRASKVFDQIGAKADRTNKNFSKVGSGMSGMLGRIGTAVGGLAIGWQAWDKVVQGGFNRLANLDDARKRLDQMGLSTGEAEKLMSELTDAVTGTAFSLDAGAGAMTGFVSAGVELDEVNDRLQATLDTAAFAQAPLDEIANIFIKIQSQGKLMGEELNMLQERGVPALLLLADAAGVTAEQMRDMISRGEIDAERFFDLWEKGSKGFGENNIKIEGAAQSMGDAIRGSLANATTALARLGEELLDEFVPTIMESAEATKDFADTVGSFFEGIDRFAEKSGLQWLVDQLKELNVTGPEAFDMLAESATKSNDAIESFFKDVFDVENVSGMDLLATATEEASNAAKGMGIVAKDAGAPMQNFADIVGEAAAQTQAATDAFSAYQDALKASTDPVFGLINAVGKVDEAQRSYNEAVKEHGANSAEAQDAAVGLFEATVGLESAAHNADLSFAGVNQVLADMVSQGALTAEQAEVVAGAIDEARGSAEDYQGPYTADLLAEIDDPAIRDAKRRLDAVARARNPKYLAELDRQAEIRARNKLNAVAAPRRSTIDAQAKTGRAEGALNNLARTRYATINVSYAVSGGIPVGVQRQHGGPVEAERPYIVGERGPEWFVPDRPGLIVSNKDAKALGGGSMTAAGAAGMDPQSWAHALVRELQRAGLVLPRVDLARRADLFARSG